jgi:A/G-specific adenine glycosylase
MGRRYFSKKIVKWYLENRRPLPWRETTNPYLIWLSEVILQQTRVVQGLPYYHKFTDAFPTVFDLANASEQEVLRLWQGLGYYTRARNLHKCAKVVAESYNGIFPSRSVELQKLPGIGHYTAAAIASLAFNEKVAVIDGNVFRVLSRVFGIDTPINTPEGLKRFTTLANELISEGEPALYNQGVMEFGALFCTPKKPKCDDCPFRDSCFAFNQGLIQSLPVKLAQKKARKRYFYYLVIEKDNALLMKRREERDIWHGLFDFFLIETTRLTDPEKLMNRPEYDDLRKSTIAVAVSEKYVHTLSHQTIHCNFIQLRAKRNFKRPAGNLTFYTYQEIDQLPKPVLISRFLADKSVLSSGKIGTFESRLIF